jgi:hypothetical protein
MMIMYIVLCSSTVHVRGGWWRTSLQLRPSAVGLACCSAEHMLLPGFTHRSHWQCTSYNTFLFADCTRICCGVRSTNTQWCTRWQWLMAWPDPGLKQAACATCGLRLVGAAPIRPVGHWNLQWWPGITLVIYPAWLLLATGVYGMYTRQPHESSLLCYCGWQWPCLHGGSQQGPLLCLLCCHFLLC